MSEYIEGNNENKFVANIDKYNDPDLLDCLIQRMESFQSKKHEKIFLDFINDDFFVNSEVSRKKLLLELFPMEMICLLNKQEENLLQFLYKRITNTFITNSHL